MAELPEPARPPCRLARAAEAVSSSTSDQPPQGSPQSATSSLETIRLHLPSTPTQSKATLRYPGAVSLERFLVLSSPPKVPARCTPPRRRTPECRRGWGKPCASLRHPCRREGGSRQGAAQTVALCKLRSQFFQVCRGEKHRVGALLGTCLHPAATLASPAWNNTQEAERRESTGRRGGTKGAPACAHNEAAWRHTFLPLEKPQEHPLPSGEMRCPQRALAESEHQLSNRGEGGGPWRDLWLPGAAARSNRTYLRSPGRGCPPG